MRIIFVGDPHFQTDNVPECLIFTEKLEELFKKSTPDYICIAGDLLHTHERLHTTPLNNIVKMIKMCTKYAFTYILVGNHDYVNNQQFLTDNHWMNVLKEWKDVKIVDEPVFLQENGYKFLFCPYVPPGRFIEALNIGSLKNDTKWEDCNTIFAHQEFYGWKIGLITSTEGDKWDEKYPDIVSGHIHGNQRPQSNVYYSGSAMQHAFGESEKNIIAELLWNTPQEKYTLIEHDLQLARKKMINLEVEDIENVTIPEDDHKYKLVVSGNYETFKAIKKTKKYREIIKKGTKVVFKPQKLAKQKKEIQAISQEVKEKDFKSILEALIVKEKNPHLYQAYEQIVNNKRINPEDIVFLTSSSDSVNSADENTEKNYDEE